MLVWGKKECIVLASASCCSIQPFSLTVWTELSHKDPWLAFSGFLTALSRSLNQLQFPPIHPPNFWKASPFLHFIYFKIFVRLTFFNFSRLFENVRLPNCGSMVTPNFHLKVSPSFPWDNHHPTPQKINLKAEKDDFDQLMVCEAPVRWSKYTTMNWHIIAGNNQLDKNNLLYMLKFSKGRKCYEMCLRC